MGLPSLFPWQSFSFPALSGPAWRNLDTPSLYFQPAYQANKKITDQYFIFHYIA